MKVKTKMKMMKINKIKARKEWIWKMILKEKINNKIKMRRMIKKMKNKTIYRMSLMMYKKKIQILNYIKSQIKRIKTIMKMKINKTLKVKLNYRKKIWMNKRKIYRQRKKTKKKEI